MNIATLRYNHHNKRVNDALKSVWYLRREISIALFISSECNECNADIKT